MKTLPRILGVGILSLVSLVGCSNTKYIPLCTGGNLQYKNFEVLAQGKDGQRLMKIDGDFYIGEEDCVINAKNLTNNVRNINYTSEDNRKILTIKDKDGNIFRSVWGNDSSFYQETVIKEDFLFHNLINPRQYH